MPLDHPNKELLRRLVVNRASNTTLGTPLCKKAGYAPDIFLDLQIYITIAALRFRFSKVSVTLGPKIKY